MCGCRSPALIGRAEPKNPRSEVPISEKPSKPLKVLEFRQEPQSDVVGVLKHCLEMAEAGHVRAVVIAVHCDLLDTGTGYALGDGHVPYLVCALERVKKRLLELDED